jgi:hypothetical protein
MARKQVYFFDTHAGRAAPCKVLLLAIPPTRQLGYKSGKWVETRTNRVKTLRRRPPTR